MKTHPVSSLSSAPLSDPLERAMCILQEAIIIINRKKIIIYINKAASEPISHQTGRYPVVGDYYLDFVHPDRLALIKGYIDDAILNVPTTYNLHYPQPDRDVWYQLAYYPMPDDNGIVTHVCIRAKDITRQVNLEKELENERKQLKNRLIKATLDAQEKQRSEIGRELHDNINQVLTTVKLYNELCLTEEVTNKRLLLRSVQQVNYCIETLRTLSKTLSSPNIEEADIKDSIKELVDEVNATRRIDAQFLSYGIQKEKISQDLMTTIYRIAQEQLTNVLKYANATRVEVMLVGTSKTIALKVQDDGIGFNKEEKRKGVGITNMVSRAETVGGSIDILTSPGNGCTLMAEFPI